MVDITLIALTNSGNISSHSGELVKSANQLNILSLELTGLVEKFKL